MTFDTECKLKSFLSTNQVAQERMCLAILQLDRNYSNIRPRQPKGGPDGGIDIEANYKNEHIACGAVGFVNDAQDSQSQRKKIKNKYEQDLDKALNIESNLGVFVFFTNVQLTVNDRDKMHKTATDKGIVLCEIYDRERIRGVLDSTDGLGIRLQYLNITLSEEEQRSFFSRWGDDIQDMMSSGFQKLEGSLNRVLFLQEVNDPINQLIFWFEFDKTYDPDQIGHFRAFCYLTLKEMKLGIINILFGSSDKSNRISQPESIDTQTPGIKHGTSSGSWEQSLESGENEWLSCSLGSSVGYESVTYISIAYDKRAFIRTEPTLSLKDLDRCSYIPFMNKSLAEKIKAIHIYSNGYKLQEIQKEFITIDGSEIDPGFPPNFTTGELEDPWVRLRPPSYSGYNLLFYLYTPKRLTSPTQVENSLQK